MDPIDLTFSSSDDERPTNMPTIDLTRGSSSSSDEEQSPVDPMAEWLASRKRGWRADRALKKKTIQNREDSSSKEEEDKPAVPFNFNRWLESRKAKWRADRPVSSSERESETSSSEEDSSGSEEDSSDDSESESESESSESSDDSGSEGVATKKPKKPKKKPAKPSKTVSEIDFFRQILLMLGNMKIPDYILPGGFLTPGGERAFAKLLLLDCASPSELKTIFPDMAEAGVRDASTLELIREAIFGMNDSNRKNFMKSNMKKVFQLEGWELLPRKSRGLYVAQNLQGRFVCGTKFQNLKNQINAGVDYDACCNNMGTEDERKLRRQLVSEGWKSTEVKGEGELSKLPGNKGAWVASMKLPDGRMLRAIPIGSDTHKKKKKLWKQQREGGDAAAPINVKVDATLWYLPGKEGEYPEFYSMKRIKEYFDDVAAKEKAAKDAAGAAAMKERKKFMQMMENKRKDELRVTAMGWLRERIRGKVAILDKDASTGRFVVRMKEGHEIAGFPNSDVPSEYVPFYARATEIWSGPTEVPLGTITRYYYPTVGGDDSKGYKKSDLFTVKDVLQYARDREKAEKRAEKERAKARGPIVMAKWRQIVRRLSPELASAGSIRTWQRAAQKLLTLRREQKKAEEKHAAEMDISAMGWLTHTVRGKKGVLTKENGKFVVRFRNRIFGFPMTVPSAYVSAYSRKKAEWGETKAPVEVDLRPMTRYYYPYAKYKEKDYSRSDLLSVDAVNRYMDAVEERRSSEEEKDEEFQNELEDRESKDLLNVGWSVKDLSGSPAKIVKRGRTMWGAQITEGPYEGLVIPYKKSKGKKIGDEIRIVRTRRWFAPACDTGCDFDKRECGNPENEHCEWKSGCCRHKRSKTSRKCSHDCIDDGETCQPHYEPSEAAVYSASEAKKMRRNIAMEKLKSIHVESRSFCFQPHVHMELMEDDRGIIQQGRPDSLDRIRAYVEKHTQNAGIKCAKRVMGSRAFPYGGFREMCEHLETAAKFPVYYTEDSMTKKVTKKRALKLMREGGQCFPYRDEKEMRGKQGQRVDDEVFYLESGEKWQFWGSKGAKAMSMPEDQYERIDDDAYASDDDDDDSPPSSPEPSPRRSTAAPPLSAGGMCIPQGDEVIDRELHKYQKSLRLILSPTTALQRMLVVWRTGSGKSQGAISCLSNFYHDPRPKIWICPNESIVNDYMNDLLQYVNPYRQYVVYKLLTNKDEARQRLGLRILKGHVGAEERKEARSILASGGSDIRTLRGADGKGGLWGTAREALNARCSKVSNPLDAELDFIPHLENHPKRKLLVAKDSSGGQRLSARGRDLFERCRKAYHKNTERGDAIAALLKTEDMEDKREELETYFGKDKNSGAFWPKDVLRGGLLIISIAKAGGAIMQPERSGSEISAKRPFKYRTKGSYSRASKYMYASTYKPYELKERDLQVEEDEQRYIKNLYDDCVIVFDEFHKILTDYMDPGDNPKVNCAKYGRLRDALSTSKNNVIIGLTATPVVEKKQDYKDLMRILGKKKPSEYNGCITYFNTLHPAMFPQTCKLEDGEDGGGAEHITLNKETHIQLKSVPIDMPVVSYLRSLFSQVQKIHTAKFMAIQDSDASTPQKKKKKLKEILDLRFVNTREIAKCATRSMRKGGIVKVSNSRNVVPKAVKGRVGTVVGVEEGKTKNKKGGGGASIRIEFEDGKEVSVDAKYVNLETDCEEETDGVQLCVSNSNGGCDNKNRNTFRSRFPQQVDEDGNSKPDYNNTSSQNKIIKAFESEVREFYEKTSPVPEAVEAAVHNMMAVCNFNGARGLSQIEGSKVRRFLEDVREDPRKTLVLVHSKQGFNVIRGYLRDSEEWSLREYKSSKFLERDGGLGQDVDICGDGKQTIRFDDMWPGMEYDHGACGWNVDGTFSITLTQSSRSITLANFIVRKDGPNYYYPSKAKKTNLSGVLSFLLPKQEVHVDGPTRKRYVYRRFEVKNMNNVVVTVTTVVATTDDEGHVTKTRRQPQVFSKTFKLPDVASKSLRKSPEVDEGQQTFLKTHFQEFTTKSRSKADCTEGSPCWIVAKDNKCEELKGAFNSADNHRNSGGMVTRRVMIAEANNFGTGVNFYGVERLILLSPPTTWGTFKQQIGRVLRSCDNPAKNNGRVDIEMWRASLPNSQLKTADELISTQLKTKGDSLENALEEMQKFAFDARRGDLPGLYDYEGKKPDPCAKPLVADAGASHLEMTTYLRTNGARSSNDDATLWVTPQWMRKVKDAPPRGDSTVKAHGLLVDFMGQIEQLREYVEVRLDDSSITIVDRDGEEEVLVSDANRSAITKVDLNTRLRSYESVRALFEKKEQWIGSENVSEKDFILFYEKADRERWDQLKAAAYTDESTGYTPKKNDWVIHSREEVNSNDVEMYRVAAYEPVSGEEGAFNVVLEDKKGNETSGVRSDEIRMASRSERAVKAFFETVQTKDNGTVGENEMNLLTHIHTNWFKQNIGPLRNYMPSDDRTFKRYIWEGGALYVPGRLTEEAKETAVVRTVRGKTGFPELRQALAYREFPQYFRNAEDEAAKYVFNGMRGRGQLQFRKVMEDGAYGPLICVRGTEETAKDAGLLLRRIRANEGNEYLADCSNVNKKTKVVLSEEERRLHEDGEKVYRGFRYTGIEMNRFQWEATEALNIERIVPESNRRVRVLSRAKALEAIDKIVAALEQVDAHEDGEKKVMGYAYTGVEKGKFVWIMDSSDQGYADHIPEKDRVVRSKTRSDAVRAIEKIVLKSIPKEQEVTMPDNTVFTFVGRQGDTQMWQFRDAAGRVLCTKSGANLNDPEKVRKALQSNYKKGIFHQEDCTHQFDVVVDGRTYRFEKKKGKYTSEGGKHVMKEKRSWSIQKYKEEAEKMIRAPAASAPASAGLTGGGRSYPSMWEWKRDILRVEAETGTRLHRQRQLYRKEYSRRQHARGGAALNGGEDDDDWSLELDKVSVTFSEGDYESLLAWMNTAKDEIDQRHVYAGFMIDGEIVAVMELRYSIIPRPSRRDVKDIIVKQVVVRYKRKGHGTKALTTVISAAAHMGRGVQLESVQAKRWANFLTDQGVMYPGAEGINYYSV